MSHDLIVFLFGLIAAVILWDIFRPRSPEAPKPHVPPYTGNCRVCKKAITTHYFYDGKVQVICADCCVVERKAAWDKEFEKQKSRPVYRLTPYEVFGVLSLIPITIFLILGLTLLGVLQ